MTGYKVTLVAIVMTGESETGYTVSLVAIVMTRDSVTGYKASLTAIVIGIHCHDRGECDRVFRASRVMVVTSYRVTMCDSHIMPCDYVFS